MKIEVMVRRTEIGRRSIKVDAEKLQEGIDKALQQAPDCEFTYESAVYDLEYIKAGGDIVKNLG